MAKRQSSRPPERPTCVECGGGDLVRHPDDHPHHGGLWHCNGCGTCGVRVAAPPPPEPALEPGAPESG